MKKTIFYCILGIALIFAVGFIIYLALPLHLISISPTDNAEDVPSDTKLELVFNKKIWLNQFSVFAEPAIPKTTTEKDKNHLTFNFKETLKQNTLYKFRLDSNRYFVYNGQKVKTTSWQFTTGSGIADEMYDMDFGDFFEKNPLANSTPFENEHFRIDWPDEQGVTPITLYAIFNAGVNGPPIEEQERVYQEQLKAYKEEALAWIRSKGIDPNTLQIYWIPEQAKNI